MLRRVSVDDQIGANFGLRSVPTPRTEFADNKYA